MQVPFKLVVAVPVQVKFVEGFLHVGAAQEERRGGETRRQDQVVTPDKMTRCKDLRPLGGFIHPVEVKLG